MCYDGKEQEFSNFEILIGDGNQLIWEEWDNSKSLENGVFTEGGKEVFYICKVKTSNGL